MQRNDLATLVMEEVDLWRGDNVTPSKPDETFSSLDFDSEEIYDLIMRVEERLATSPACKDFELDDDSIALAFNGGEGTPGILIDAFWEKMKPEVWSTVQLKPLDSGRARRHHSLHSVWLDASPKRVTRHAGSSRASLAALLI